MSQQEKPALNVFGFSCAIRYLCDQTIYTFNTHFILTILTNIVIYQQQNILLHVLPPQKNPQPIAPQFTLLTVGLFLFKKQDHVSRHTCLVSLSAHLMNRLNWLELARTTSRTILQVLIFFTLSCVHAQTTVIAEEILWHHYCE